MVGDGHTVSVAAQIVQHIFGATEGTFQVDHPVLSKQRPQPGGKDLGLSEVAGPSTPPAAKGLRATVNPMDSRPHASDVGRDADIGPSLSGRYGPTGFEWCAGQHHPRVD